MKAIRQFVVFFVLVAFVVTCNFLLFLNSIDLDRAELDAAAPITFFNIILLSVIFCLADQIRRYFTVKRPLKRIHEGMERIIGGDFETKIESLHREYSYNDFDEIVEGLNKMAKELGSVETLRTDFISNVSHEMKTPLAVMQNLGTLLQAPDLSEEKRLEYATAITEQTRRMSSLITNILKLNKLENQQIYPNVTKYNLGEQLCECMLGFESEWEKKEIEIDVDIEEDVLVNADPELLSLVWNNLLSNAIKFTDHGGKVGLALTTDGDKAIIQVSDTGCGISPETGKNIFQKFYQGDTSHATQGNGLGLALVKRVIDISGGEISVSSRVGVGSIFTVFLRREERETNETS